MSTNGVPQNFEILFTHDEVERAIDRIAVRLNVELAGKPVVFICVMHGGLPFTWDLMKRVDLNLELDFVRVRRYDGTKGGLLDTEREVTTDIQGKEVVIVDDVLDRGVTLCKLFEKLSSAGANVRTAVLCRKRAMQEIPFEADYVALHAPDRFLIGRGMDMDGMYRHLPAVYAMRES